MRKLLKNFIKDFSRLLLKFKYNFINIFANILAAN